jgi:SAM-dependent methyltransferase
MAGLARLTEHYNAKYGAADFKSVTPVPLVKHPKDRRQLAVSVASRQPGGRYLEIGAGDGGTILPLVDLYDELVGTDLSSVRTREMQLLFQHNPRVQILQNNLEVEGLPFGMNQFDTVAMIDVIEHLVDPIGALIEIHRVLKPNGRLIVHTPNIAKWTRRVRLLAGYFPSTASYQEGLICHDGKTPTDLHDEGHLHYFTFRSLRRLAVERAGFTRVVPCGYGKPVLCKVWPELFSELSVILYK